MAVVLTYPEDPGQLGKNAAGVVAAFTATGYQNEGSGLTVTITDETLGGRILGSGASNTDPEPSGTYAGWWAFSVYCPAFDSTGASIVYLESAAAAIASAASLRVRSAASVSGTAADSSASTETAEGYTGATSEVVLSYADGSARLRAIIGDVFSSSAADASAGEVTAPSGGGITYVGAGTAVSASYADGATISVPLPAGVQSNDIMILVVGAGDYGGPSGPASGWTALTPSTGQGFVSWNVYWRRAGSSESAPSCTAHGDDGEGPIATNNVARIFAFRGCYATGSPFDATAGSSAGTGTSITGSSISTANADAMICMIGGRASVSVTYSTPGASVDTIVAAANSAGSTFLAYDDAPSNSAGSKSAPTATGSTSTGWSAYTFALRKA